MYEGCRIAAVVPAYNESKLIGLTISTMPDYVDHIVVIDDCSTDDTSAQALKVGDPRVVLIEHEKNTGVGGAILDGHRRALELGADINVVMAGDAQMDPEYLPNLLDPLCHDGYEFTKANRFFSRTSYAGMPALRLFGSVVLSFMIEAVCIAVIGGILGCIAVLPVNGLTTGTMNFQTFSHLAFAFQITPQLVIGGIIFSVIMGIAGGVPPAVRAARSRIAVALREL